MRSLPCFPIVQEQGGAFSYFWIKYYHFYYIKLLRYLAYQCLLNKLYGFCRFRRLHTHEIEYLAEILSIKMLLEIQSNFNT